MLKEIQGRATDFVFAADGTMMHGLALIYILRDLPGIRQFKIVQETLLSTRILIVPDETFEPACVPGIEAQAKARLGAAVRVTVERVDRIAAERSGKFRYVVSQVRPGNGQETSNA